MPVSDVTWGQADKQCGMICSVRRMLNIDSHIDSLFAIEHKKRRTCVWTVTPQRNLHLILHLAVRFGLLSAHVASDKRTVNKCLHP